MCRVSGARENLSAQPATNHHVSHARGEKPQPLNRQARLLSASLSYQRWLVISCWASRFHHVERDLLTFAFSGDPQKNTDSIGHASHIVFRDLQFQPHTVALT